MLSIVVGYRNGTRHGIFVDTDGLVAAGEDGHQLTWMDAKVGEWVVTPRRGKPVEVQALWLNALFVAQDFEPELAQALTLGLASFARRFETGGDGLYDVVDVDHVPGAVDQTLRPNQIFAVGGLPLALLPPQRCRRVVELVERELLTPLGLRSLARSEALYAGSYQGGPVERDGAYHQGTVWPWLLGAFVDAWLKVRGNTEQARAEAQAEAARQKAMVEAEIEASANRAREDLRRQVSVLAVTGAEKLLKREIDANAHKALLDELAAEI